MRSSLPLHAMIQNVIDGAKTKLAADEQKDPKVKNLLKFEKKEHGHIPSVEEEKEEYGSEKVAEASFTDPTYVEKLASAVDWLSENVDAIEPPGPVALALAKVAETGSPGGAGKGKGALTVSKSIGGQQSYKKDHPATEDASKSTANAPLSAAGLPGGKTQLENNMHDAPGNNSGSVPHTAYPPKGPLVNLKAKTASATSPSEAAKNLIMEKLAGEDTFKANISAPRTANPLAGKGGLQSFDSTQAPPKASGGPTSGFGNQGRKLISSNQAAIDYKKKDAKSPVKAQLKEVLDEPALSRKTDTVVPRNLRNADKGGVKIAQVRNRFAKIAAAGCTCGGKGECQFCSLKDAASRARGREKVATMGGMGMGGGASMGGSVGGMGGGAGGGMSSMAGMVDPASPEGLAESDRVRRLKLLLMQARGGAAPGMGVPGAEGMANPAMAGGAPATGAGVEQPPVAVA